MNKKRIMIVMSALLIGAMILGLAGSVYAQTETPEVETEMLPAPVVTRGPRGAFCDGSCDADGDGVPDRWQPGGNNGTQPGNGFCPGDGSCDADGDGIPDQLRLRDGSGTGQQYGRGNGNGQGAGGGQGAGNGQGAGFGTGTGMGYGAGQGAGTGRGAGGTGQGMGPGQGQGNGQGLHDGSCLDD